MSLHCLLASMALGKKPAINCIDACLYMMSGCSLAAFTTFCWFKLQLDYAVARCGSICIYHFELLLNSDV